MAPSIELRSLALFALLLIAGMGLSAGTAEACFPRTPVILGDFNNDGHQDLVIGSSVASVSEFTCAGVVHVIYGTGSGPGFSVLPQQVWHLDSPGVSGNPDSFVYFGRALAAGDFDCDGIDDLAIGEKNAVTVLYGSLLDGLTASGSQRFEGPGPSYAEYGMAVAAGNFGYQESCGDTLAVGAAQAASTGQVYLYHGAPGAGLLPASETIVDQDSPGVPGTAETLDWFGRSLVVGNFDGDAYEDLAVGVSGETIGDGDIGNGDGAVSVFYGGGEGFELSRSQIWHQGSAFVHGKPETMDFFGKSLGAGDFDGDGYDDLIVAVPGESDEHFISADLFFTGAVNVIHGSPTGLKTDLFHQGRLWSQDSDGIKGKMEAYDVFGGSVVGGDFDGDGYHDMAVGVPLEDREGIVDDGGVVNVIFGGSGGLQDVGDQLVHQNTSGEWVEGALPVVGDLQDDDWFGDRVGAGRVNDDAYDDLLVVVLDGSDIAVNVIFGSASGLTADGNHQWTCEGLNGCSAFRQLLNLPSIHAPVTDGIYTDPPGTGEWSDVLPLAFSIGADGPVAMDPNDTSAVDSTFFASLGPEANPEVAYLNLHFDFVKRTDTNVFWTSPVATIRFPATIPGLPEQRIIGVHLIGAGPGTPAMPPAAWLDLDGDGEPDDSTGGSEPNVPASVLGIEASAGFAASPYESTPHLQVEIRVPLSIQAGFPDPSGPLASVPDGPGGIYAPAPGFWTVEYVPDSPMTLTTGAMALLEIQPDGAVQESAHLTVDRVVDVVLLDDLGDGNGLATLAILSTPDFDATTLFSLKAGNAGDPGRAAWPTSAYSQDVDSDGDEDQVVEFASADLLANGVLTPHGADLLLTGENSSETVAGNVTGLTLPQAGFVSDGEGPSLTIKKRPAGGLKLFWGDSCVAGDTDYAVYEGTLGIPASHRPVVCSTGGSSAAVIMPGEGSYYYLVVPLNPEGVEGGHGTTSTGAQRPQGILIEELMEETAATCMPQFLAQSCDL